MSDLLTDYHADYPKLELFYAEHDLYSRFRSSEPQLVSVLDKGEHDFVQRVVALRAYGNDVGITSYTVHPNLMRKVTRAYYARIDLVIVPESYRGKGISTVTLCAALLDILKNRGKLVYSISCLAGHPAIAHLLERLDFIEKREKKDDFRHFEYVVDDQSIAKLQSTLFSPSRNS